MDSTANMMKREELNEKLWSLVKGWGDRRIVNFLMSNLPIGIAEDFVETIEEMPEEEKTPKEAFSEGRTRADLKVRLLRVVGEEVLDMSRERLIQEMALEMQIPALQEFTTHLENSGEEICKTWRPKLVQITVGKDPENEKKPVIFGYFKTDITEEELIACHKAYLIQNNWDFETNIPDGFQWKLRKDLKEAPDAIANGAGWTRYVVGELD